MKVIPVILAGGAGVRLWPLSRDDKPKQFHNLTGEGTLIEQTIKRLLPHNPEMYLIVTSIRYEAECIKELNLAGVNGAILSEPCARNTAAAIIYGATYLERIYDESIMIILPSDHYIKENNKFLDTLNIALEQAMDDKLVTIGIKPTYPETGYGYIKACISNDSALPVERFIEKPDIETARKYIIDENYFWNSGIFVWKTSTIIKNFKELMPQLYNAFKPLRNMSLQQLESNEKDIWKIKDKIFNSIDSISIDHGILEKEVNKVVVPASFGWSDLGSWDSIDDVLDQDEDNNRSPDNKRVVFVDSKNCSVFTDNKRVALVGVNNLVVVESGNDILVMEKSNCQKVREVVEIIKKKE